MIEKSHKERYRGAERDVGTLINTESAQAESERRLTDLNNRNELEMMIDNSPKFEAVVVADVQFHLGRHIAHIEKQCAKENEVLYVQQGNGKESLNSKLNIAKPKCE
ncbi:hypothetical protein PVAG01_01213 [Phlyctema vagabunda]|uniref:Uncharacterized protein n=1 Tax=Phlyctema vagabunda TaxID=108571 RepID=A0ABR4PWQ5_9HELO